MNNEENTEQKPNTEDVKDRVQRLVWSLFNWRRLRRMEVKSVTLKRNGIWTEVWAKVDGKDTFLIREVYENEFHNTVTRSGVYERRYLSPNKPMRQPDDHDTQEHIEHLDGKPSDASTCSSRFYAGAIVSHKLNNIKGIITSKGTLRNGGQCWNVRFERDNYFEELEAWEHELFLPRTAPHTAAHNESQ